MGGRGDPNEEPFAVWKRNPKSAAPLPRSGGGLGRGRARDPWRRHRPTRSSLSRADRARRCRGRPPFGTQRERRLTRLSGLEPQPRFAHYARLRDPQSDETLDRGLALFFPAPASATGEDCAELHLHGGPAVVGGMLAALAREPGLRAAGPGEFARRAFLNGRLKRSQIEALADLIEARTAFQRRQALRLAGGALRRETEGWRGSIVEALARVESDLDFADETEVASVSPAELESLLAPTLAQMDQALAAAPASERLREGFLVAILGPPNAGKSTLLNRLRGAKPRSSRMSRERRAI